MAVSRHEMIIGMTSERVIKKIPQSLRLSHFTFTVGYLTLN